MNSVSSTDAINGPTTYPNWETIVISHTFRFYFIRKYLNYKDGLVLGPVLINMLMKIKTGMTI